MTVGQKISAIRKEKGLTIKDLSIMSKIGTGRISQIENDKANPSLSTLSSISGALGVSLSSLFEEETVESMVVRGNNRPLYQNDGTVKHYLLTNQEFENVKFYYRVFEPGFTTDDYPEMHPPGLVGYDFAFVIQGKLIAEVEGTPFVLNAGDSICFEAQKEHRIKNITQSPTEVVWLNLTNPGLPTAPEK